MGAVTGAIKGSVAGPEGAVVGAVAGKTAKDKEDRASRAGDRVGSGVGRGVVKVVGHSGMKMLMAEFLICIIILGLSPLAGGGSDSSTDSTDSSTGLSALAGAGQFMLKGSATFGLFLVLGMIAAIGPNVAKWSAGIGGLVTLAVVFNAASSFEGMVTAISSAHAPQVTATPAPAPAPNAYSPPAWAGMLSIPTNPVNANTTPGGESTLPGQGVGPLDVGDPNGSNPVGGGIR